MMAASRLDSASASGETLAGEALLPSAAASVDVGSGAEVAAGIGVGDGVGV